MSRDAQTMCHPHVALMRFEKRTQFHTHRQCVEVCIGCHTCENVAVLKTDSRSTTPTNWVSLLDQRDSAVEQTTFNVSVLPPHFTRPARPPRRLVTRPCRAGRSAITSARASCVMRDHAVISSIVRRHPVHSRDSGWITQILMQGLSISARF